MTAAVASLDVSVTVTGNPSVAITGTVVSGDVLVAIDIGAYANSGEHLTSVSGLGGTWTKQAMTTTPFDVWVGIGCSGTGSVSGSGGATLTSVNRRRLMVWRLTGVTGTISGVDTTAAASSATTDAANAVLGQIVLAVGFSSSPPSQAINAYTPTTGWSELANSANGAYNLTSDNVRYGKPISRVPAGASESHTVNAIRGAGATATVGILVIGDGAPDNPTSVVASGATATTIDLSWSPPAGGATVTSYEVRANGGSPVTATSPHTFTGLTPSTSYTLEVRAVGPGGTSAWVGDTESTLGVAPDQPINLDYVAEYDELVFTWEAALTGDAATGYDVRIDGGTPVDVGNVLTYTFPGLTSATAYDLEVRAYNANGDSPWSFLAAETLSDEPPTAYTANVRIGSHFWQIEAGDPADTVNPEVLAGATFVWTAPDNVGWPPPMTVVPRDNVKLRVRVPDASDVADVRKGDIVRFKFTPEGYTFGDPLVDFAGVMTGEPVITDDPSGGVFLEVVASDYRVLFADITITGATTIGLTGDTYDEALTELSTILDGANNGHFPGGFGDMTVGAVDPRGFLAATLPEDVAVGMGEETTAMALFSALGYMPVPQYDDDGDLDPVQPFRIIEVDVYGADFDTPAAVPAAIVPNPSLNWRRDYTPTFVEDTGFDQYVSGSRPFPTDMIHEVVIRKRLGGFSRGFNLAGFLNELAETEPWGLYAFSVLGYLNPETVRNWFNYPDRVRQYITVDGAELIKNPSGTDSVSGMLKAASLIVGPRGRWVVTAGMRRHGFNII